MRCPLPGQIGFNFVNLLHKAVSLLVFAITHQLSFFTVYPLYTGRLLHCYMLDESVILAMTGRFHLSE